jgi:hypothetical protein
MEKLELLTSKMVAVTKKYGVIMILKQFSAMWIIIILCLMFSFESADAVRYCVHNGNTILGCYDNLRICKEFENQNFRRNDECKKEKENHTYPKSVEPKSAKKGTCLWMFQNKKWNNLGCMETQALCKYAERQYKAQAKVECR